MPNIPYSSKREFFVDFEIIPEVLTDKLDSVECKRNPFIFLIGVGHFEDEDGGWCYNSFIMDELTMKEELRVLEEFIDYIKSFQQDYVLYHWYRAEPQFWKSAMKRHDISFLFWWYDLSELFTDTPIVIKDCMNFSLKNVAKAMYKHNMINTNWTSDISNGLECAAQAALAYNDNVVDFTNIITYNEIDCKVLFEILQYLRKSTAMSLH